MIDILSLNPQVLFGAAGAIGGLVVGIRGYFLAKKESKKAVFDMYRFSDTITQAIGAGVAFSMGLPVTYVTLGCCALVGAGVDTITNKYGIQIIPLLKKFSQESTKKKKK